MSKRRPSRILRATMRTTFESSTIRQDFMFQLQLPSRSCGPHPCCFQAAPRPGAVRGPANGSGGLDAAVIQSAVHVEHHQPLLVQAVDAQRVLAELRVERRRIALPITDRKNAG